MPTLRITKDQVRGCVLGGAIGDALGAPFEGLWAESIPTDPNLMAEYAEFEGFPRGQYTDDTQMTLATLGSIVARGAIEYSDIARKMFAYWPNDIIGPGGACTVAANNFRRTLDWRTAGAPRGHAGNGTAMRTAAVGLLFVKSRSSLSAVVGDVSRITHQDALSVAGGIAIAAAACELAANEAADPHSLADVVADSIGGTSEVFATLVRSVPLQASQGTEETRLQVCSALNPSYEFGSRSIVTPYVVPTVLAALFTTMRHMSDWSKGVAEAIRWGGDTDTVGSIVGALLGARLGASSIPPHLISGLADSSRVDELAQRYYLCIKHQ